MANELIGPGFEPYIDTRSIPGQTQQEYVNKLSGQGITSAEDLVRVVQPYSGDQVVDVSNVFDVVKRGLPSPVQVDLPREVPAQTLEQPTSQLDVNNLIAENRKLRDQMMQAFQPTQAETDIQKQLFGLQNEARNTELNAQAGLNAIEDKPIAMEFITGQQASLQRQANLALQTNAFKQQPLVQNLQLLQQQRQAQMEALQAQQQFGQFDINLAMQMQQVQREEQKAAREFAMQYNIQSPAFSPDGITVYATSDGKPLTEQEFFTRFGFKSWKEVPEGFIQREFITDEERIADRNYQLELAQLNQSKYQAVINPLTGESLVFDPKTGTFQQGAGTGATDPSQLPFFGLPPKVYDKAAAIATQFDSEAIVKNFNVINEAKQFIDSLSNDTNSPTDDQGLIYSFAKAMDPNSVVREGEYATVQRYSQSWLESFGFNAKRVIDNGEFLTPEARANLKATINQKHDASLKNYQNVFNEYSRRIDQAAGKPGIGQQLLTDYSKAYGSSDLDGLWDNTIVGGGDGPPLDLNQARQSGGLTFNSPLSASTSNAKGANAALLSVASTKFPAGTWGGQCGDFVRKVATSFGLTYPTLGNSLTEKTNAVKKHGTPIQNAGIGSVIITKENPTYGHVAWIIGKNDKGWIVAESNFKQSEKISYGRVIPYNSGKIVGVINPTLRSRTA